MIATEKVIFMLSTLVLVVSGVNQTDVDGSGIVRANTTSRPNSDLNNSDDIDVGNILGGILKNGEVKKTLNNLGDEFKDVVKKVTDEKDGERKPPRDRLTPREREAMRRGNLPPSLRPPSPDNTNDNTLVIAVVIPTVGVVFISVVIALAAVLYKRRKNRANRVRKTENVEGRDTASTPLNTTPTQGAPTRENQRVSEPNVYITRNQAEEEDLYQTLQDKEMITDSEFSSSQRIGPLPRLPIPVLQENDKETLTGKPMTPPRATDDEYYSYAVTVSQPKAPSIQSPEEDGQNTGYIDIQARRESS